MPDLEKQNQQLQSTLGKMDLVLGSIDEAILWTNVSGQIEWCNEAFIKLINGIRITTLGRNVTDFLSLTALDTGESIPHHKRPFALVSETQKHNQGIYVYQQDTKTSILELNAYYIHQALHDPSVIIVIRDITKQRQLEEEHRIQEERLEQAMNATEDGFWDNDLVHHTAFHSDRCKAMLGYPCDDKSLSHDQWIQELLHPEDKKRVLDILASHIQNQQAFHADCRLKRQNNGAYQWYLLRGKAIFDAHQKPFVW
jgi:PAS domain-containing protein